MWQYSYLFDSKEAFDRTLSDSSYKYDMPFDEFMQIYQSYKNNGERRSHILNQTPQTKQSQESKKSEILDQNEIDMLIESIQMCDKNHNIF